MKYSGIEWIGEIPDKWVLERLQWHLDEIKESNAPVKTRQVLSLTNKLGVIPYEEKGEQGNKAKENLNEYKLAYPSTIVANSMNILIGSVGKCNYFGCVSPVYYVFKPKENENIDFINYIFQSTQFQKELRKYANGILEIRLRVSSSDILKRCIAFPSKEEQQKIVEYLNHKIEEIDSLIEIENQQIEKLEEIKKSIIRETISIGIDKNVIVKKSSNKFISNMNSKWENIKIKYLCDMQAGESLTSNEISDNGQYPVYGGNGERGYYNKYNCDGKYLLVGRQGALCGNVHYVEGKFWATEHAVVTVPKSNVNIKFLYYMLEGINLNLYVSPTAAQPGLSVSTIQNVYGFLPKLDEQLLIVDYLDKECVAIDSLIEIKQQKIDKLNEYKKSLIYEYVTGKKEVC